MGRMQQEPLWVETVHDAEGRFAGARLELRADGLLVLSVGDVLSVLDDADARSLFAALGRVLQGRDA